MNSFAKALVALVLLSAPAHAGDIHLGEETPVAPEIRKTFQMNPAVAFGKDVYLVVWQDGPFTWECPQVKLWMARVSATGKVLNPKGLPLCQHDKRHRRRPRVAFDGTNFLVVWAEYNEEKNWDVSAARVSPEGEVLDEKGFAVAHAPGNQCTPVAATNGAGKSLAAWADSPGPQGRYQIMAASVDGGGRVGAAAVAAPAPPGNPAASGKHVGNFHPEIAFDGRHYVLTYVHLELSRWVGENTRAAWLSPDGKPVKTTKYLTIGSGNATKRARNGCVLAGAKPGESVVRYIGYRGAMQPAFTRYTGPDQAAGTYTGPGYTSHRGQAMGVYPARGAFDGKQYVLAWQAHSFHVVMSRVAAAGEPKALDIPPGKEGVAENRSRGMKAETQGFPVAVGAAGKRWCLRPAIASDGKGKCLVVYEDDQGIDNRRVKFRLATTPP